MTEGSKENNKNEKSRITRREFFKTVGAISYGLFFGNLFNLLDSSKISNYIESGKVKIGFLGEIHGVFKGGTLDRTKATQFKEKDLFQPAAGLFLEGSKIILTDSQGKETFISMYDLNLSSDFLREVFRNDRSNRRELTNFCFENRLPFFIADLDIDPNKIDVTRYYFDDLHPLVFSLVSANVASTALMSENISRREFIKKILAGLVGFTTLASLWQSSSNITNIVEKLRASDRSVLERDLKAIFSDLIHPENHILVLRNILWAIKIRDYYERDFIKDGIINIVAGKAHKYLDFFYTSS